MEIFSKTFLFYLFNPWIRIVLYTGMKHCFFQYYSSLIKKYGTVCIWKCVFTFVLVASLPEVTLWLTVLFMSSSCLAASSSEDSSRRMSSLLAILSSSSSFSSLSAISAKKITVIYFGPNDKYIKKKFQIVEQGLCQGIFDVFFLYNPSFLPKTILIQKNGRAIENVHQKKGYRYHCKRSDLQQGCVSL